MRLLLASLLASIALSPTLAHANQCDAGRPMFSNREIPIGCPIRAYLPVSDSSPLAEVVRGGTRVDVTGTITPAGTVELPVHYDEPDFANQCQPTTSVGPHAYAAFDLTFTANVGEVMELDGSYYRTATVVAAGPCPAPEEYLNGSNWIQCSAGVQDFQACHDMLCTPFASDTADCDNGSNDELDPSDPGDPGNGGGCAATSGAVGGPLGLLLVAFLRYRRRR